MWCFESCPGWNSAPARTLPRVELCLAWIQISKYMLAQYVRLCMKIIGMNSSLTWTPPWRKWPKIIAQIYPRRGKNRMLQIYIKNLFMLLQICNSSMLEWLENLKDLFLDMFFKFCFKDFLSSTWCYFVRHHNDPARGPSMELEPECCPLFL